MSWRLGVDIGGTFTDFVLMNISTGELLLHKVPSTPDDPSRAVIAGLRELCATHRIAPPEIEHFGHGSTVGTNTLIERRGAKTALLVTEGFGDVLIIGRLTVPNVSDLQAERPLPLVPRKFVREVRERMLANGEVHVPLDVDGVGEAVSRFRDERVETIAICFHHSYRNAAHETLAKRTILQCFPDAHVSVSSEVWPEIREYERTVVTTVNAYIGPRVSRYYRSLDEQAAAMGIAGRLLVTRGNGGIMTAVAAAERPVATLQSGPASGVAGAWYVSQMAGIDKLITLDIGGTSADVAIVDGRLPYSTESYVGDFPVIMPMVDVSSVGAGGGSVAWVDSAGVLKVGPESAGANPGPACYGLGGTSATLTDAYLGAGIIDPERFLGGRMKLHPELALAALRAIGERIGRTPTEAAQAIIEVVTARMYADVVRLISKRGVDLSEFSLFLYGGAGPTQGFLLARELGIDRVIVPAAPGLLCALGCLTTDIKADFVKTLNIVLTAGDLSARLEPVRQAFRQLDAEASTWLRSQPVSANAYLERSADMRYLGQSYEITVPLRDEHLGNGDRAPGILRAFHEQHDRVYGHSDERSAVELVSVRNTAVGPARKPTGDELARSWRQAGGESSEPKPRRGVVLDGRELSAAVYDRDALRPGARIAGPAIIEQYDSTVLVPDDFTFRVDPFGNLVGERQR